MNTSFNENLTELLKTDSRFVDDEGELIKAAVIDQAWKIDRELVKLLLSDSTIKEKFFDEIEGQWILNTNNELTQKTITNYINSLTANQSNVKNCRRKIKRKKVSLISIKLISDNS